MLLLESAVWAPNFFQQGGYFPMSVVTVLLIALLLAAWKAPGWVKEIGLIAFAFGILWITAGMIKSGYIMQDDNIIVSPNVVWNGVKCWLIPVSYSIIVYIVSLVIRIIREMPGGSVQCWTKWIGLLALVLGLLWIPVGLIRSSDYMTHSGDITPSAIWFGVKNSLIPFAISLIVFIISLIIRIVIKPRNRNWKL